MVTKPVAYLQVPAQFGKAEMRFPIFMGVNIIGKSKGDIHIGHDFISGIHASIEVFEDESDHWLEDLESTNGTYFGHSTVSLRPRRFYQLTHGKLIRLGRTFVSYEMAEQSAIDEGIMDTTADKTAILPQMKSAHAFNSGIEAIDEKEVDSMEEHESIIINDTLESANNISIDPINKSLDNPTTFADNLLVAETQNEPIKPSLNAVMEMAKEVADAISEDDNFVEAKDNLEVIPRRSLDTNAAILGGGSPVVVSDHGELRMLHHDNITLEKGCEEEVEEAQNTNDQSSKSPCFPSGEDLLQLNGRQNAEVVQCRDSGTSSRTASPTAQPEETEVTGQNSNKRKGRKKTFKKSSRPASDDISSVDIGDVLAAESVPVANPERKTTARRGLKKNQMETPASQTSTIVSNNAERNEEDKPIPAKKGPGRRKRIYNADETEVSSKSKQAKIASDAVCVMFTGVEDCDEKSKILTKLGAKVVESWKRSSHLVTTSIKRTTKMLCAISSGKQIVSADWIKACQKAKCLIDASDYPLNDSAGEKKWSFKLAASLQVVKERGPSTLYKELNFLITPSTKPDYGELKDIIEAGGGRVLSDLPVKHDDRTYIIGAPEDKELIHQYQSIGWKEQIFTTDFILTSSLKQTLDFVNFRYSAKGSRTK